MSSHLNPKLFNDGNFYINNKNRTGWKILYDCYWELEEDDDLCDSFKSEENFKIVFNDIDHNGYNSDYYDDLRDDETIEMDKKVFNKTRRKTNRRHSKNNKFKKSLSGFSPNTTIF